MDSDRLSQKEFMQKYHLPQVHVRLKLEEGQGVYSREMLDSPEKAIALAERILRPVPQETVLVCNLDSRLRPVNFNLASVGTINQSIVEIASVFKSSILTANCANILLFHNHPTGLTEPSQADYDITRRITQAGALLGINVVDHVIIGGGMDADPSYSFHDHHPELFTGAYDAEYIQAMLSEGQNSEIVSANTNLPQPVVGRRR